MSFLRNKLQRKSRKDNEEKEESIYQNVMASATNYFTLQDDPTRSQQQQGEGTSANNPISVEDQLRHQPPPDPPSQQSQKQQQQQQQSRTSPQRGRSAAGGGGGGRGRDGGGSGGRGGGHVGLNNQHRGFSTSIHDIFSSIEDERVDCCALTCCGMLQNDRDRYLLQGITPPSLVRRFILHILFPTAMFGMAGFAAMHIPDVYVNQLICTSIILFLLYYLVMQCFKGRTKRMEIRKDLLWTKAQLQDNRRQNLAVLLEQERPYDDEGGEPEYYLGQTKRDFSCAHPCCLIGFYAEDRSPSRLRQQECGSDTPVDSNDADDDDDFHDRNIANCMWNTLSPPLCGMHVQCCGFCALAQEAREIESSLLPASYRRVDYMTMQSMSDYYPTIYQQRWQDQENGDNEQQDEETARRRASLSSFPKLSRLSIHLLQFVAVTIVVVFIWCFAGKYFWKYAMGVKLPEWRIFKLGDFIIYLCAWLQSLILLAILAYLCNRPKATELSLDAMIKYFFAGFFLSTSLAVFWELFLGLSVKAVVSIGLALGGVDVVVDTDGYQANGNNYERDIGFGQAVFSNPFLSLSDSSSSRTAAARHNDYLKAFGNDHPIFYTVYLLVASFLLAAFVEEVCKYFGYRMIDHPDFMTQQELDEAMQVVHGERDDDAAAGDDEHHGYYEEQGRAQVIQQRREEQLNNDFSKQRLSIQAHGGAITLAMICVAMGFTCCENLVYIFIYSGSSFYMELFVLISRALFPVHPIAAAIQSLGVVKRDLEHSRKGRLGRGILLPAVLFHGSYDFFILWIDFLLKRKGVYADDVEKNAVAEAFSFIISLIIMAIALFLYSRAAGKQRARLQAMDNRVSIGRSRLT